MATEKPKGIFFAAASLSIAFVSYLLFFRQTSTLLPWRKHPRKSPRTKRKERRGLVEAIGNTPLIRINSLSEATGCEILGKAEFLNPGGSVKDRVAVKIIEEALESGALVEGGMVTEGSAGSTAISLATVAPAYGCKCHVVIPDDAAAEKMESDALLEEGKEGTAFLVIWRCEQRPEEEERPGDGRQRKCCTAGWTNWRAHDNGWNPCILGL